MSNSFGSSRRVVLAFTWVSTLLASSLDVILWRELAGNVPYWLPCVHAIGLTILFVITLFQPKLKSLKTFVLILLIIFLLGFGGGWQWGLIPFVRGTSAWTNFEQQALWALSAISTHPKAFSSFNNLGISAAQRKKTQ